MNCTTLKTLPDSYLNQYIQDVLVPADPSSQEYKQRKRYLNVLSSINTVEFASGIPFQSFKTAQMQQLKDENVCRDVYSTRRRVKIIAQYMFYLYEHGVYADPAAFMNSPFFLVFGVTYTEDGELEISTEDNKISDAGYARSMFFSEDEFVSWLNGVLPDDLLLNVKASHVLTWLGLSAWECADLLSADVTFTPNTMQILVRNTDGTKNHTVTCGNQQLQQIIQASIHAKHQQSFRNSAKHTVFYPLSESKYVIKNVKVGKFKESRSRSIPTCILRDVTKLMDIYDKLPAGSPYRQKCPGKNAIALSGLYTMLYKHGVRTHNDIVEFEMNHYTNYSLRNLYNDYTHWMLTKSYECTF